MYMYIPIYIGSLYLQVYLSDVVSARYFDCELGESPALEDEDVAQRFRYEFESGAVYDGEWLEGNRHGFGKQAL